jgi:hypothetical protein
MLAPVLAPRQWLNCLKLLLGTAGLLVLLSPASVRGTVFDWPSSGWTAGAPAPGQTVTQSFTNVTPNDITVSINNNGASNQGATWQTGYPAIDSTTETGGFSGVNALQIYVVAQSSTSSYIRTTVTFSNPVINLSFQIWDVDAFSGQFADRISNIQAIALGGTTVWPDSVTSAIAGYNTITGTGLSTIVLGTANAANNTNQGTIDISFAGPITQFSFDWSNNDPALGAQAIALGPLTYTIVPEMSAGWVVALLCSIAIAAREIGRRRTAHCARQ